jgi:trigger factor
VSKALLSQEVTVQIHRKPACAIEFEVVAPPELVAKAKAEAIKEVNKEVSFPGFRKGKAPAEMVVKNYPQAVESKWHKAIADAAFSSAQMQARVPVLNTGAPVTFDLKQHSLEEGAKLVFSFETEPVIPSVDPKQFHARPVERKEVGEKEIDEAVRQTRFFYASWNPVTERGIQNGDYIVIDLDTLGEDPQKVFNHIRFEVSKERMASWMQNLVIGKHAGDTIEGMSEPDADASEEEKAEFTPKLVRITIYKVEEASLPELNDEFAKKMGATDVPAMKAFIQSLLERNVEEKVQSVLREQVNEFLSTTYQFELPLSLIEAENKHRKAQAVRSQAYAKMSDAEKRQLEEKLYTEANQAVRLFYLSRQVVREAKLSITQEEVQKEAVQAASAGGSNVHPDHLPKEQFALALSKVILTKAQDYIIKESQAGA